MRPWLAAAARVAVLVLAAIAVGWVFGSTIIWLTVLVGGLLLWHLGQLYATLHWLKHAESDDPPDAPGLWGDLIAGGQLTRDQAIELVWCFLAVNAFGDETVPSSAKPARRPRRVAKTA